MCNFEERKKAFDFSKALIISVIKGSERRA